MTQLNDQPIRSNELIDTTYITFEGTASDFETQGIKLNGRFLDKITVGNLAKHGIIEVIGEGPKPKRGRTPAKYKAVSSNNLKFEKGL